MPERKVDLAELIFAWQDDSPDNAYYLDARTGQVRLVNQNLLDLRDLTDEIERNRERFFYLPKRNAALEKSDLNEFLSSVQNEKLMRVLPIAFESPHPLSAFRKILSEQPSELERFEQFRRELTESRVLEWLASNAIPLSLQIDNDSLEECEEDYEREDFSP